MSSYFNLILITKAVLRLNKFSRQSRYDYVSLKLLQSLFKSVPTLSNEFRKCRGFQTLIKLLNCKIYDLKGISATLNTISEYINIDEKAIQDANNHNCLKHIEDICRYRINTQIESKAIQVILKLSETSDKYPFYDQVSRMIARLISIISTETQTFSIRLAQAFCKDDDKIKYFIDACWNSSCLLILNSELLRIMISSNSIQSQVKTEVINFINIIKIKFSFVHSI
jgi:hypothetical protein